LQFNILEKKYWEETPGKTQDTLERLCLSADLGRPRGLPGGAGGSGRGQGNLGFSAQAAAPATRPPEKRQIMDGWMKLLKTTTLYFGWW